MEFLNAPKLDKASFVPRAVVVGFGPIGQKICQHLLKKGFHVTIIDQNIDTIASLKGKDVETIFGDAAQLPILEKAQIDQAKLLAVSVPDLSAAQSIIEIARSVNPYIEIVARFRFQSDLAQKRWLDIAVICDEEATAERFITIIDSELKES